MMQAQWGQRRATGTGGGEKQYVMASIGNPTRADEPPQKTLGEQKRQKRAEALRQQAQAQQQQQPTSTQPQAARSRKPADAIADSRLAAMLAADNGRQLHAPIGGRGGGSSGGGKKKGLTYSELKRQGHLNDDSGANGE